MEYDEVFDVVLMENSSRLDIQSGRDHIQITIVEDDDCKSNQVFVIKHPFFF